MTEALPEAEALVTRLRRVGWTAGAAESLTGGLVAAALVAVPGASVVFRGGIVAYATDLKHALLGVDDRLLLAEGPVSPRVAVQMAEGARIRLGTTAQPCALGLATTGIAGPDSPDGQPVGTVHVAVATPSTRHVESLLLTGSRDEIRAEATRQVLALALAALA